MNNTKLEFMANNMSVEELVKMLEQASDAYYNSGEIILSDDEYDFLVDVLKIRSINNDFFKVVGAIDPKEKVKLPYNMGSLDKLKTDFSIKNWKKQYNGFVAVMEKLDGVSLQIVYIDGNVNVFTRGNGEYGRNISHILKYVDIPKIKENLAIRAEILIPKSLYTSFYKETNSSSSFNLRNCVSGLINRVKSDTPELKYAHVVAYEIINSEQNIVSQLSTLQQLGFKTPKVTVLSSEFDCGVLSELLLDWKSASLYDIDGLVISTLDKYIRNQSGNPEYSFAFKQTNDDNIAIVSVEEVEWNISRHGIMKPVLIVEPVKLAGVMVSRVTAHNASIIFNNRIGVGTKVKITRSGDVIPYLLEVIEPSIKPSMPSSKWKWNDSMIDIIYHGDDTRDHDISIIEYFFDTIGVERIKKGIITKLYDNGFDTIKKIMYISEYDLLQIDGIKSTLAKKITNNIYKAVENLTLDMLMNASGIFGIGLGQKRCFQIINEYPNFMNYTSIEKLKQDIIMLPGFSDIMAQIVVDGYLKFKSFYEDLGIKVKSKSIVIRDNPLVSNKIFIFTGFRNEEWERLIVENGGKIGNTVTKNTHMVIVKDIATSSSKIGKAKELNVKICYKQQFEEIIERLK